MMERREPKMTIEGSAREVTPRGPIRRAFAGMSSAVTQAFQGLRASSPYAVTGTSSDVPKGSATTPSQFASHARKIMRIARYAYENDGIIRHAYNFLAQSVAGSAGPVPRFKHRELKGLFELWAKNADPSGDLPFGQLIYQAYLDSEIAGDAFIRIVDCDFDGRTVPIQLQLVPSEMVPHDLNETNADGTVTVAGIVFRGDKKVGYRVYTRHPDAIGSFEPLKTEFVPVEDMCHIYRPIPGKRSVRGVSRAVAAFALSKRLQGFFDNMSKIKEVSTLFAGFIKDLQGSGREATLPNTVELEDGGLGLEWDGGMLIEIPAGKDIVFPNIPDNAASSQPFIKSTSLVIAASMDLPYAQVFGDWSDGDRTGQLASTFFDQFAKQDRDRLEHQAVDKIVARFVTAAVAFAIWQPPELVAEETWADHTTAWPSRTYKHPVQDIDSKRKAMDAGTMARDTVIEETGEDPRELDLTQSRSLARALLLGITHDSKVTFVETDLSRRIIELERIELEALITAMERSDRDGSILDPK